MWPVCTHKSCFCMCSYSMPKSKHCAQQNACLQKDQIRRLYYLQIKFISWSARSCWVLLYAADWPCGIMDSYISTHSVIGQFSSLFSCVRPACGLSHLNIRMFDICWQLVNILLANQKCCLLHLLAKIVSGRFFSLSFFPHPLPPLFSHLTSVQLFSWLYIS